MINAKQTTEPFKLLVGREGHYLYKRNRLFEACVKIDENPEYPAIKESFHLVAPKIPLVLFAQALAFLGKVHAKHESEGIVLFTLDPENAWSIYVPMQKVGGLHLEYENDEHRRVVGSIHSHPGIASNASTVDEKDEFEFDGLHMIVNGFAIPSCGLSVIAAVNGRRFRVEPGEVIQGFETPAVQVPDEWLDKVEPERKMSGPPEAGGAKLCAGCLKGEPCTLDVSHDGDCPFFEGASPLWESH